MIRVAACRMMGMHTADTQNLSRFHEQASQPGERASGRDTTHHSHRANVSGIPPNLRPQLQASRHTVCSYPPSR